MVEVISIFPDGVEIARTKRSWSLSLLAIPARSAGSTGHAGARAIAPRRAPVLVLVLAPIIRLLLVVLFVLILAEVTYGAIEPARPGGRSPTMPPDLRPPTT
ncbi:hypothetical protein F5Y17DRAFT_463206 [Xylariaceae sp. FL0594]|nr:hypothetical protein F5Y17DRAFT_463206 [Xylariaceae sp. FL0594]